MFRNIPGLPGFDDRMGFNLTVSRIFDFRFRKIFLRLYLAPKLFNELLYSQDL